MNKQELMKKCNEIILKTNGGNDDYVVALCQISMAIAELDEPKAEECEIEWVAEQVECLSCNHIFTNETLTFNEEYQIPDDGYRFYKAKYCPNCGKKIKKGESK